MTEYTKLSAASVALSLPTKRTGQGTLCFSSLLCVVASFYVINHVLISSVAKRKRASSQKIRWVGDIHDWLIIWCTAVWRGFDGSLPEREIIPFHQGEHRLGLMSISDSDLLTLGPRRYVDDVIVDSWLAFLHAEHCPPSFTVMSVFFFGHLEKISIAEVWASCVVPGCK